MPFFADQLANMVKLHSSKQDQSYGNVRYAEVKEYDPENNVMKVAYYNPLTDDTDLTSGWLPLVIPFIGIGDDTDSGGGGQAWGHIGPPNIGQPVLVLAQQGDFNSGIVLGGTYSSISPVPQVDGTYTQNGEWLVMHKKGSYIKFWNDMDINVYATANLNLHSDTDTNVISKGDLLANATGQIMLKSGKSIGLSAQSQVIIDAPTVTVTNTLVVGNGATGQFESDGFVISVENGIVTNIAAPD